MDIREAIESKLKEIDSNVYYGRVTNNDMLNWNYIIFGKERIKKAAEKSIDLTNYYWITIVRENYIPDDTVYDVINKLNSIPGLHLSNEDGTYQYIFKDNTELVVELVTLVFAKTKKCGNLCP